MRASNQATTAVAAAFSISAQPASAASGRAPACVAGKLAVVAGERAGGTWLSCRKRSRASWASGSRARSAGGAGKRGEGGPMGGEPCSCVSVFVVGNVVLQTGAFHLLGVFLTFQLLGVFLTFQKE